jgi:hypothetical protein
MCRFVVLGVICCAVIMACNNVSGDDARAEDRFAEMLLKFSDLPTRYEVTGASQCLISAGKDNTDVSIEERVFRQAFDKEQQWRRIDVFLSRIDEKNLEMWQHGLVNEKEIARAESYVNRASYRIDTAANKPGTFLMVNWANINLVQAALVVSPLTRFHLVRDNADDWGHARIIEGREAEGQFTIIATSPDGRQAWKFTFGTRPEWAPIKVDLYIVKDPRSTRFKADSEIWDQLPNSIHLYSTSTEWFQVKDDLWLPRKV